MAKAKTNGSAKAAVEDGVTLVDKRNNTVSRVNEHGLTEKQEAFARGVANGSTLADSYKAAYDASAMSISSIYSEASRLMDNPAIASRAKALMRERSEKRHSLDALRIRQHVLDRLMIESEDEDNKGMERLKALEMLGNVDFVSMFKQSKGEAPDSVADSAEEIARKLRDALGKLIDITPNRDS